MKTLTIAIFAVIAIASSPGSLPILVLCSASEADSNRLATSNLLIQATLVVEYVRLNGIFRKRQSSGIQKEK